MNTIARSFTRLVVASALLVATQLFAVPAAFAGQESTRGTWIASTGDPAVGANWGHLSLREGNLIFNSPNAEWQVPLGEITRVALSERSDRLIVIESAGQTRYVSILSTQMLVESPRPALAVIQKALRPAAARRER